MWALVTLVLIKRITLEDESNTHLALGRGVRGEGACTGGHGAQVRARSNPGACRAGWRLGVGRRGKGRLGACLPQAGKERLRMLFDVLSVYL